MEMFCIDSNLDPLILGRDLTIVCRKKCKAREILAPVLSFDNFFDLDEAPDLGSKLCRAWIINGIASHALRPQALAILSENQQHHVVDFLNRLEVCNPTTWQNLASKENIWDEFCENANSASSDPEAMFKEIRRRRALRNICPAEKSLRDPAIELVLTSNILVSPPLDPESINVPKQFRKASREFFDREQDYWYDHPIPIDASDEENEIIYGLRNLDAAIAIEHNRGFLGSKQRIDLVLSLSVTHDGMEVLARRYVEYIIRTKLKLQHLNIFLFDENLTANLIKKLSRDNRRLQEVFGVNGAYGRHYNFLKAVLVIWNRVFRSAARFTFKIDLDQVFDQNFLVTRFGKTALQLLCNKNWGGSALDWKGRDVELGLISGGLINKADWYSKDLTPDIKRPENRDIFRRFTSKRIFCSQWPQAISTEAEILYQFENSQRVHVTGGTTGITLEALQKWKPFTPSFINRAEDQAYAISSISESRYLTHLHAPGLIMRHDKNAFAGRVIAHASDSKAIGDVERILFFSNYTKCLEVPQKAVSEHLWPFTSSFIVEKPEQLVQLIFSVDGSIRGDNYVSYGAERLKKCLVFCNTQISSRLDFEKQAWNDFYKNLTLDLKNKGEILDVIKSSAIGNCGI